VVGAPANTVPRPRHPHLYNFGIQISTLTDVEAPAGNRFRGWWVVREQVWNAIMRPFAQAWLRSAELAQSELPQPLDPPHVHTAGVNPDRVLLVGSGATAGVGVLTHELGLAGHLARNLSALTGRAIELDVSGDNRQTARTAIDALGRFSLARFDALILQVGTNEAVGMSSVRAWHSSLTQLADYLDHHAPASLRVFLVGVPPLETIGLIPKPIVKLGSRRARALNAASRDFVAGRPRITFVDFEPDMVAVHGSFRSSETYDYWARILAMSVAPGLSSEPSERVSNAELRHDEQARQKALDSLAILDTEAEDRFDRITLLAQKMFGTAGAAISFIDRERQWFKSHPGIPYDSTPRSIAFGAQAITSANPFVVEDARLDERFADSPLVTGRLKLLFYAGHPIDAPDGEHVGTLCIVDTKPRSFSEADAALLRNLAMMAQNELLLGTR
jgi:hypothetical protein